MKPKLTVIAVSLLIALTASPMVAAAQESPTPTPSDESQQTYLIEIDDSTRIVSSEWNSGTVTFVVEADSSTTITVTDASIPLQEYDAVDIPRKSQQIPEGRTEVSFSVTEPSDAAVTVATSRGLVGLSPGSPSLFSGSASWSDVQIAAVSGAAGVGSVAIIVVIRTVLGRTDSPERVA
jgi:hypothetical protein